MAGMGHKRTLEERRKARQATGNRSNAKGTHRPTVLEMRVMDAIAEGENTEERLCAALGRPPRSIQSVASSLVHKGYMEPVHEGIYRLSRNSPQWKALPDATSLHTTLTDLVPLKTRRNLSQLSVRDKIVYYEDELYRIASKIAVLDPIEDMREYRLLAGIREDVTTTLIKLYRCEAEINPSLMTDALSIEIPGFTLPGLDASGQVVPGAELDRRQAEVAKAFGDNLTTQQTEEKRA